MVAVAVLRVLFAGKTCGPGVDIRLRAEPRAKSPHPPSPLRRFNASVVRCRDAECRCDDAGAYLCDAGLEPASAALAPPRSRFPDAQLRGSCRPGVRHLLCGYQLARLPIRLPDRPSSSRFGSRRRARVARAPTRRPERALPRHRRFERDGSPIGCTRLVAERWRPPPPSEPHAVNRGHHAVRALRQSHTRRQPRTRVRAVDARNQPLELARDRVEFL